MGVISHNIVIHCSLFRVYRVEKLRMRTNFVEQDMSSTCFVDIQLRGCRTRIQHLYNMDTRPLDLAFSKLMCSTYFFSQRDVPTLLNTLIIKVGEG